MAIKIIDEQPDVTVTSEELRKYKDEYSRAYMHYVGTPPSLEQYIRQQKHRVSSHKLRLGE